jgi:pimeloyl-ACP methyl ester carboxylesterase
MPNGVTSRGRLFHRSTSTVALLLGAALVATGCTSGDAPKPVASQPDSGNVQESASPGLGKYYSQKVKWSDCGDLECASIKAPLDYSDPSGKQIELALNRLPASGSDKIGSLLINPGGPGGSGTEYVKSAAAFQFSKDVKAKYDLVGFDPRGVGKSTAVACRSDKQNDEDREKSRIPTTTAQVKAMLADSAVYAKDCETKSPAGLLENVDTDSAARDLDLIRAAVGDKQLNYAGFSYGTKLGSAYLRLFPKNSGRMLLDGAMDPRLSVTQTGEAQAKAFERALDLYLKKCLTSEDNCPYTGSVKHARAQLSALMKEADKNPLKTASGRVVPASDIYSALLIPLYEPSQASIVTTAIGNAMKDGDGTALLAIADISAERQSDGSYSNTNDAFTAVNCLDYPHESGSVSAVEARAKNFKKVAPFFGPALGYDDGCSTWAANAKPQPSDYSVKDPAHAPLIVGTTGDPATPYPWSKSLQKLITGSRLLTYQGEGHTAYGRSNQCVTDTVDDFLLSGNLPSEDKTC